MVKIRKLHNLENGYESKDQLLLETEQHRLDVAKLMMFLALEIVITGNKHDWSKIQFFDDFANDVLQRQEIPDFKEREWYNIHTKEERHHLNFEQPDDVDLIDVLEFVCDCICTGKARDGHIQKKFLELPGNLLKKAYWNTIDKLSKEIDVDDV